MEKIKKAYYYFFYSLYKLPHASGPISRQYSSVLLIIIIETAFVISLNCYYIEFFDKTGVLELYSAKIIIPLLVVLILNYFAFEKDNKWENYVNEFDKWPKSKKIIGFCIVFLILVIGIYCIQYSLSTMRQISANRHVDSH